MLILTDDQRSDELSVMPNVESLLAGHGVTFSNYFATTPSCCPSRTSLLTGQYSHHTGVYDGPFPPPRGGALAFHDSSTLATWLHDDGYETALMGKYLNGYWRLPAGYVPPGWDEWDAIAQGPRESLYYGYELSENGTIVPCGSDPADYSTTVLAARALSFIRSARPPFFLYLSTVSPHVPAIPAPGDENRIVTSPALALSFNQSSVSGEPWGRHVPPLGPARLRKAARVRTRMLRSLLAVDRTVKDVVDTLDALGELNDTYIFYASDNGYPWGEHRVIRKLWPFEESIRVPLVVRLPNLDEARTDQHLILNIDIAATVTELAGTTPGLPQDGRSFVPLLEGRSPPWRTAFVEEFLGSSKQPVPGAFIALRTERYMYVEYKNGWRDLYDLRRDPYELDNIAADAASRSLEAALSKRLHQMFRAPARGTGQQGG